jgi:SARP family transcriptional regulator, regulator of embCAB operon
LSSSPTTWIQLCGRLVVRLGSRRIEGELPGRQGRALFAYLCVNRVRGVSRDELIDALWWDRAPAGADATLSTLVSKLRRVVGAERLQGGSRPQLLLAADAWIDVEVAAAALHRAESAAVQEQWTRAWAPARAALHTASRSFLLGHDAPWIEERRGDLEELRLRALECVAASGIGLGGTELAAVERSARALVHAAPFRESGYRFLMEFHAARGDVGEALRVHETLRVLLRDELGAAPAAATQALHARLLRWSSDPAASR